MQNMACTSFRIISPQKCRRKKILSFIREILKENTQELGAEVRGYSHDTAMDDLFTK